MTPDRLTFFSRPAVRRAGWALLAVVFVSGIVGGIYRGTKADPDPDWGSFLPESRYVWEHGRIPSETPMFGYPPAAFFALWPFTVWVPQPLGLIAFVTVNVLAAVVSAYVLWRWWFHGRPSGSGSAIVWPLLLFVAHFQHVLQANQLTIWILALCVVGLTLLMRRRPWLGGFVLGAAACIKVTPLVFVAYLALRRQWRGLGGMVLAIILLDVLPSVIFFGPGGAIREHRGWRQRVEWYSNERMIEQPLLRTRAHGNNCSYSIVLARWLRPSPEADYQVVLCGDPPKEVIEQARASLQPNERLVLDPRPMSEATWERRRDDISGVPRFHLASFSAPVVRAIWAATLIVAIGALAWATFRRRRTPPGGPGWTAEASMWLMAMFWLTPMMRDYYLAIALPAYIVVWHGVSKYAPRCGRRLGVCCALGALAVFPLGGFVGLVSHTATWYGLHLATLAMLAAATAWTWCTAPANHPAPNQTSATEPSGRLSKTEATPL